MPELLRDDEDARRLVAAFFAVRPAVLRVAMLFS